VIEQEHWSAKDAKDAKNAEQKHSSAKNAKKAEQEHWSPKDAKNANEEGQLSPSNLGFVFAVIPGLPALFAGRTRLRLQDCKRERRRRRAARAPRMARVNPASWLRALQNLDSGFHRR